MAKGAPLNGEKTGQAQVRDEKGRFAKGNCGGGRPKLPEELREAFQAVCPEALEVLAAIMRNKYARNNDRIRAAEIILERGYGKAPQSIDLAAAGEMLVQLSTEAMERGG